MHQAYKLANQTEKKLKLNCLMLTNVPKSEMNSIIVHLKKKKKLQLGEQLNEHNLNICF